MLFRSRPGLRSDRQRKADPDGWRFQPDAKADPELQAVAEAQFESVAEHVAVANPDANANTKPDTDANTVANALANAVRLRRRRRSHVVG